MTDVSSICSSPSTENGAVYSIPIARSYAIKYITALHKMVRMMTWSRAKAWHGRLSPDGLLDIQARFSRIALIFSEKHILIARWTRKGVQRITRIEEETHHSLDQAGFYSDKQHLKTPIITLDEACGLYRYEVQKENLDLHNWHHTQTTRSTTGVLSRSLVHWWRRDPLESLRGAWLTGGGETSRRTKFRLLC